MPKVRRVLGACTVEIAQRQRICYRDRKNHSILKGTPCLVVKDAGSAKTKNYCPVCALIILDQAADDLQALRAKLS
jgi:hypothetical protein